MPRPEPLVGRVEGHLIAYGGGRRRYSQERKRALADGTIDREEALRLLHIVDAQVIPCGDAVAKGSSKVCKTVRHVTGALTGADGLGSVCVGRSVEEFLAAQGWEEDQQESDIAA